jgi:hypothetical protein
LAFGWVFGLTAMGADRIIEDPNTRVDEVFDFSILGAELGEKTSKRCAFLRSTNVRRMRSNEALARLSVIDYCNECHFYKVAGVVSAAVKSAELRSFVAKDGSGATYADA